MTVGSLVAAASSLGAFDQPTAGVGGADLTACDTDGVRTSLEVKWDAVDGRYEITGVTVSGVSDACDGQTLTVRVDGTEASLRIPAGPATSFELPLEPAPAAEDANRVHVVVAG